MNKTRLVFLITVFCGCVVFGCHNFPKVDLGIDYRRAQSAEFSMKGHPASLTNRWELKHPLDSDIFITGWATAELKKGVFGKVFFGGADLDDGTITDTDWDASGVLSDMSYSTSRGNTRKFGASLYYKAFGKTSDNYNVKFFGGYHWMRNSVIYINPTIVVQNYTPVNIPDLEKWNEYRLIYDGFKFGVSGEVSLGYGFGVGSNLGFIPYLRAKYNGLRYPERLPAQQQKEVIYCNGNAFDFEFSVFYKPISNIKVNAGWWLEYFKAEGKDVAGTSWAGSFEELKSSYKGLFLGVHYEF